MFLHVKVSQSRTIPVRDWCCIVGSRQKVPEAKTIWRDDDGFTKRKKKEKNVKHVVTEKYHSLYYCVSISKTSLESKRYFWVDEGITKLKPIPNHLTRNLRRYLFSAGYWPTGWPFTKIPNFLVWRFLALNVSVPAIGSFLSVTQSDTRFPGRESWPLHYANLKERRIFAICLGCRIWYCKLKYCQTNSPQTLK